MTHIRLTDPDDLRLLPDGALLTVPGHAEPILWLRAYTRPHADPDTGLWCLPRNPFAEHHVKTIDAEVPDPVDDRPAVTALRGDEEWLTTLTDPHDTTDGQ